jgi:putative CRISPR-associated protein (TIGR02619 family)
MNRIIINTVGTSLVSNFRRTNKEADPTTLPTSEQLLQFLRENPEPCAEVSFLKRLSKLNARNDNLYFLGSSEEVGELCTETLAEYYRLLGFMNSQAERIHLLNTRAVEFEHFGLPNLFNTLSKIQNENPSGERLINATGGFKAQTAYAVFFGLLFGIPVYYYNEQFKDIVEIPAIPVVCDRKAYDQNRNTIGLLLSAVTNKDARPYLEALPRELQGLFHRKESGKGYEHSAVGQLFLSAVEHRETASDYPLRSSGKSHACLWGTQVLRLDDIPDKVVRDLIRKVYDIGIFITDIFIGTFDMEKCRDTHMVLHSQEGSRLHYELACKDGHQFLTLETLTGKDAEVLRRLGRQVYP